MGDRGGRGRSPLAAGDVLLNTPSTAPPQSLRTRLVEELFPQGSRVRLSLCALVWTLAAAVAFARGGLDLTRVTLWAEDGVIFIHDALTHPSLGEALEPAQGYLNVVPRLIAWAVSTAPVSQQAALMAITSAAVQASVAVLAYVVFSSHRPGSWMGLVLAALVASPTVGPETVRNVANLQWFLLFAACWAMFWRPRSPGSK